VEGIKKPVPHLLMSANSDHQRTFCWKGEEEGERVGCIAFLGEL